MRRAPFPLALCCLAQLVAPSARAQMGFHPMPKPPAPLHERIAQADVVAVGRIEAVEPGRLRVGDAVVVSGGADARFEVKRAPASPPPLEAGQSALLVMRGARSPYVLVGEARETTALADASSAPRVAEAVAELVRARADEASLRELYFAWLDADVAVLREWAVLGLVAENQPLRPLPGDLLERAARSALDPARSPEARRGFAEVAVRSREGAALLVAKVPGSVSESDPQVASLALMAGRGFDLAETPAALSRTLRHERVEVRRAGISIARSFELEAVRAELERTAANDPEEELRNEARRTLTALERRDPPPDAAPPPTPGADATPPPSAGAGPDS
jgi:hypothetical protein